MLQRTTLSASAPQSKSVVADAYGKLPLSFEPNCGQADGRVKFLSRGQGYALFLTPTEAVLTLRKGDTYRLQKTFSGLSSDFPLAAGAARKMVGKRAETGTISVVRISLVGANPNPRMDGLDSLPGKANYFTGKDPAKWRTNIPTYSRIAYRDIYPGIDQIYYGVSQRRLEYDLVVAPGGNPDLIRLRFEDAQSLRFNRSGDLVLAASGGEVVQHAPVIYQEEGGRRKRIDGKCVLIGTHTIGFQVASYDRSRPLVIDPGLGYSTYLGDNQEAGGSGIAVDASGNAYVAGGTSSLNFPMTAGSVQAAFGGGTGHAFITKLNASGTALLYSTYLGGSLSDGASAIAVDSSGNAYIAGGTDSLDFPTTEGAFQTSFGGPPFDAFITKLNSSGTALVYSTYLGGGDIDVTSAIAVDSSGAAYVTGCTRSVNFPTTTGAFQTSFGATGVSEFDCAGFSHAFVTKLRPSGTALAYSTYLGGSQADGGTGIAVDAVGNAYVVGGTKSGDFPTTSGAAQIGFGGSTDAFITKLNASGTALLYSTFLGGSLFDYASAVAVDSPGNAYVTGETLSPDFPITMGAFQTTCRTSGACGMCFVAKLNSGGTGLAYSTFLSGTPSTSCFGIAVVGGEASVTGLTLSADFPTTPDAFQTSSGPYVAFVTRVNPTGASLVYSSFLGGSIAGNRTIGYGIAVDPSGNAYITGETSQTDFPTSVRAFETSYGDGFGDAFVTKLNLSTAVPFASFTAKLERTRSIRSFDLNSNFTLGTASDGINPVAEAVTLQIGTYSVTIPGGSFTQEGKRAYVFRGTIGGTALEIRINPTRRNGYEFQARGNGANLEGIASPVTIALTIGDDTGDTQVRIRWSYCRKRSSGIPSRSANSSKSSRISALRPSLPFSRISGQAERSRAIDSSPA